MNTPENKRDFYLVIRRCDAVAYLDENEQKQLLELASRLEKRAHWWGYGIPPVIVIEPIICGDNVEWRRLKQLAKRTMQPVTYVDNGGFKAIPPGQSMKGSIWGVPLEEAMATSSHYWEWEDARDAERNKAKNGAPDKSARKEINLPSQPAADNAETACQSHIPMCPGDTGLGQLDPPAADDSDAR